MIIHKAAKRYAQALFEFSIQQDSLDAVHGDIKFFLNLISTTTELRSFLQNPELSSPQRQKIIDALFKDRVAPLSHKLLSLLIRKNRLDILESVCEIFINLYMDYKNIIRVTVTTPKNLAKDQIELICQKLKSRFRKEIQPTMEIKPELIGGFKLQLGDLIYDFSIQSQLEKFKRNIINAQ